MHRIIQTEINKTLDMKRLRYLLPPYCRVVRYDEILKAKTLKDAMGGKTILVLLFNVHDKKHRVLNQAGHFFCISTKNKQDGVVVFSSTGMSPKRELFVTSSDPDLLLRILPNNFKYNNVALQKGNDSNTCWRWIIVFAHLAQIGLKTFQDRFKNANLHVNNSDELVTLLTYIQLAS
jgi:hypothetical protein